MAIVSKKLFRERLSQGKRQKTAYATIPKVSLGHNECSFYDWWELTMQRPYTYSEDLRWRAIWMKELLGYSVDKVGVILHISRKNIQRYVLKCLNTGDIKAENFGWPWKSFVHPHVQFVVLPIMPLEMTCTLFPNFFWNSCMIPSVASGGEQFSGTLFEGSFQHSAWHKLPYKMNFWPKPFRTSLGAQLFSPP